MFKLLRFITPLVALVALVAAVACGDDATPVATTSPTGTATPAQTATTTASATATGSATEPATAGFPVTLEHKFGRATIETTPDRVLTIGFSEQDVVLALGVAPIAVREWFGEQPYATWPWAQDELGTATPEVLNMAFGELDYEAIAALRPDVIIATHSGITADEYAKLADIAPTVAQTDAYPDFGMPWQEQALFIGRALGLESRAQAAVAATEAAIEAAREAHPALSGARVAWASAEGDGSYWAVGPATPPMRFLTSLGLQLPEDLASAIGDLDSLQISGEQAGLLDADILVFPVESDDELAAVQADPVLSKLAVIAEGRTIHPRVSDPVYASLAFSTVLSLPYAIEQLVPQLATIADRSTATPGESETRIVDDYFGPVEVPANPQRVVAESSIELGNMIALGLKPIGAGVNLNSLPGYLADQMEGVVDLTTEEGIDLEKALELKPDLILAGSGSATDPWNKEACDLYRAGLPATFCYAYGYTYEEEIKKNLTEIAGALNVEEKAGEVIAAFDARVAELRTRVEAAGLTDKPVSVVRLSAGGNYSIRIGTTESIAFRALGIPQPEGQQNPDDFSV